MTETAHPVEKVGLLDLFNNVEGALTVGQVASIADTSETRAQDLLKALADEGKLERGKNGRAFVYWKSSSVQPSVADTTPPSEPVSLALVAGSAEVPLDDRDDAHHASLALLRKLGGKAYCGARDDEARKTIDLTAALELERQGVITIEDRNSYRVAVLTEEF